MINKKEINIDDYKKIILIHTVVLSKDYRKKGIVEELVEMFYRDFYGDNVAIILLAKPFQDNLIDAEFYLNHNTVTVKNSLESDDDVRVSAMDYYSLTELLDKTDTEINEYKLFNVANKCGFQRINNSYLFLLSPEDVIERMMRKQIDSQEFENEPFTFL